MTLLSSLLERFQIFDEILLPVLVELEAEQPVVMVDDVQGRVSSMERRG
jgi:hypothetical protein